MVCVIPVPVRHVRAQSEAIMRAPIFDPDVRGVCLLPRSIHAPVSRSGSHNSSYRRSPCRIVDTGRDCRVVRGSPR